MNWRAVWVENNKSFNLGDAANKKFNLLTSFNWVVKEYNWRLFLLGLDVYWFNTKFKKYFDIIYKYSNEQGLKLSQLNI